MSVRITETQGRFLVAESTSQSTCLHEIALGLHALEEERRRQGRSEPVVVAIDWGAEFDEDDLVYTCLLAVEESD